MIISISLIQPDLNLAASLKRESFEILDQSLIQRIPRKLIEF